jgi:hypothetical protein
MVLDASGKKPREFRLAELLVVGFLVFTSAHIAVGASGPAAEPQRQQIRHPKKTVTVKPPSSEETANRLFSFLS